uniref:ATP synthase F0 subunit 8 n=1 Tax=Chalcopis glandulosa TaxID=3021795 RepID=UPI0023AB1324|nr:ATP synthase F0 subunit 8 [Chalcopis glandulosa]WCB99318.1 ATP synthase F0 subunit 8 [Chalcopis glandulosa]
MPQMAPMMWETLFMFFLIMFIFMNLMIYFMKDKFSMKPNKILKKKINQMNWLW